MVSSSTNDDTQMVCWGCFLLGGGGVHNQGLLTLESRSLYIQFPVVDPELYWDPRVVFNGVCSLYFQRELFCVVSGIIGFLEKRSSACTESVWVTAPLKPTTEAAIGQQLSITSMVHGPRLKARRTWFRMTPFWRTCGLRTHSVNVTSHTHIHKSGFVAMEAL